MCYAHGSIDQAVKTCPMCKVFPHGRGCPHTREVCRNRANHPRFDVVYIKNAEVDTFNGCGYCKWAKTDPPAKTAGYFNQGWPGCCRPPTVSEFKYIPAADWKAVSIVHHVPIPGDVRALLDRAGPPMRTQSGSPTGRSPTSPNVPGKAMPQLDRRNSNPSPNPRPKWGTSTPPKARSPQLPRSGSAERERLSNKSNDPEAAPRKSSEHDGLTPRRQPMTTKSSSTVPVSQVTFRSKAGTPPGSKGGSPPGSLASVNTRSSEIRGSIKRTSATERRGTITQAAAPQVSLSSSLATLSITKSTHSSKSSNSSSSHSSGASSISDTSSSSGSMTDGTVTSDGGFTDYLSDDSEEEIQRQAEARAVLVAQEEALRAQATAEEMEFKAARQQLVHVDLRPPRNWANPSRERVAQRT